MGVDVAVEPGAAQRASVAGDASAAITPVGVLARVHNTNMRFEPRRRLRRYSPTTCVPFSISTTFPEPDITSHMTTHEVKPATADDIAGHNPHGSDVPC